MLLTTKLGAGAIHFCAERDALWWDRACEGVRPRQPQGIVATRRGGTGPGRRATAAQK